MRNILAETLITVLIKVTGNLSDPTVPPLSPKAIGEGVLGIMKRTLELPLKIIQPIIPGEKAREHQRGE